MATDIITLEKQSLIAERLKSLAKPIKVVVDGEVVVEVNPLHPSRLDNKRGKNRDKETDEDRQAYAEAIEDYHNGVNFTTIDLEKAQTFEGFIAQLQA
jgi:pyruvate-formate lyase-activating enzyme